MRKTRKYLAVTLAVITYGVFNPTCNHSMICNGLEHMYRTQGSYLFL